MRAKIYSELLVIVVVLSMPSITLGDQGDDLYNKYVRMVGNNDYPSKADYSWVTPEVRQILIQKAYAAARNSNSSVSFGYDMALIELGDQQTIQALINDYDKGKVGGVMPSIQLLPYLINDIYNGSTKRRSMNDASIRDDATHTIYLILKSYPNFRPETRQWADQKAGETLSGGDEEGNLILRTWWEHNKDAVLAHRYNEANWLPSPEQEKALQASLDMQNNTPQPFASPSKSPKPASVTAGLPADNETSVWWPIGIAAVIMTAGFFLLRFALVKKS